MRPTVTGGCRAGVFESASVLSLVPLQLELIDDEAALYAASACGCSLAHVMGTTLCA